MKIIPPIPCHMTYIIHWNNRLTKSHKSLVYFTLNNSPNFLINQYQNFIIAYNVYVIN